MMDNPKRANQGQTPEPAHNAPSQDPSLSGGGSPAGPAVVAAGDAAAGAITEAGRGGDAGRLHDLGQELYRTAHAVPDLIRDRTYHAKTYRLCFVGDEFVTWLVRTGRCGTREEAVMAGCLLLCHGIIHHVVDDHQFRDQPLFYRFRRDNGTYLATDPDVRQITSTAVTLNMLMWSEGLIGDKKYGLTTYKRCFVVEECIGWMVETGLCKSRAEAAQLGHTLQLQGHVHHVLDQHDFREGRQEYLYFRFHLDELRCDADFQAVLDSLPLAQRHGFVSLEPGPLRHMDTAPLKALQPQSVSLRSALAADPTAQLRQRSRDARELHSLDEYHVALESRAGIVVGFTAPWCGPCMDIFPRFRELAQSYSNIACFVVDVEENNDTALECGIIELPTFLFYRLGQKVDELQGASVADLTQQMGALNSDPGCIGA